MYPVQSMVMVYCAFDCNMGVVEVGMGCGVDTEFVDHKCGVSISCVVSKEFIYCCLVVFILCDI